MTRAPSPCHPEKGFKGGLGKFMAVNCLKNMLKALMLIKLFATVLMVAFPQFLMTFYPFAIFSPLFLAAASYGDVSIFILIVCLIIIGLLALCFFLFSILLFLKKGNLKLFMIFAAIFCIVEAICFIISLFGGTLAIGKILGVIFNTVIIYCILKLAKRGCDAGPVLLSPENESHRQN